MSDRRDLLVGADDEAPTAGERLRASRVGTALLAHPWRSLVAAGALVLAAGAIALVVTRPPPLATADAGVRLVKAGGVMDVYPPAVPTSESPDPDRVQTLGGTVWLARTLDDAVTVVGVVGPGLSAPRALDTVGGGTGESRVRTLAQTDCAQDWWRAEPRDYAAEVVRIDAWGRTSTARLTLGDEGGIGWRDAVRRTCAPLAAWRLSVVGATATARPGRPEVSISLDLRNRDTFPLWVHASTALRGASPVGDPVLLPAKGSAQVTTTGWVTRCPADEHVFETGPTRGGPGLGAPLPGSGRFWRLPVLVSPRPWDSADLAEGRRPQAAAVPVTPEIAAEIDAALGEACRGAPRVVAQVIRVRAVRAVSPQHGWRVDLALRAPGAERLRLGPEALEPPSATGVVDEPWRFSPVGPGQVEVVGGRAAAVVSWTLSECRSLLADPRRPTLLVVARRGELVWPQVAAMDDAPLLAAARGACPGFHPPS